VSEGAGAVPPIRVALTFDAEHPDRPHGPPGNAVRILDELREAGATATFFVQGRWAESHPDTARRLADDGHRVANHSKYHARMSLLSDDGIRADVRESEEAIQDIVGIDPRPWFRCPFGDGRHDPRVLEALDGLGYRNVHWHVEAEDWEPKRTSNDVERITLDGIAAHGDGAVVLMHTWAASTATSLPAILDHLGRHGARFATVDELEALP
jgi:peptidoglycan/xylan/chitin deacetylase (PgdA/CDA1 family)